MWDLPGPGLEPVSPALAGGFLTTAPPGKPPNLFSFFFLIFEIYFIYLWLRWVFVAMRRLFSSCGEQGLLFVVVRGLLIAVASRCGARALRVWAQ